jgi:hypothetical protein
MEEEEQLHEGNRQKRAAISKEDKQKITELLKKPWNPYIRLSRTHYLC